MVANPQGVGDDSQSWVYRRARDEKAGVHHVQVVQVVGLAVRIQHRGLRIATKAQSPVLVGNASQGDFLSQVERARDQMVLAADFVEHRP